MNEIRVLAVDDHPLLREGIAAVIQDERDIVLIDQACNGMEAIDKFRTHRPDVTLILAAAVPPDLLRPEPAPGPGLARFAPPPAASGRRKPRRQGKAAMCR